MRKSVLSFLLVPLFMVVFGFSAFAGEFDCDLATDYEFDDVYIEVEEVDYNTAFITLVNESEDSIYVGTDSVIYESDLDGNIGDEIDTFTDDLIEIMPGGTWTYQTWEMEDEEVIACHLIIADVYGDLYQFAAVIGFF